MSGDDPLSILAALALIVFACGAAVSAVAWLRGAAALASTTALFALGLARQIALLFDGETARAVAESAVIGVGIAGFAGLRALRRVTRERDRAEDIHWDSMETVRMLTELAAGTGSDPRGRLAQVLELGTRRFGLEHAVAWSAEGEAGRALGVHSEGIHEPAAALPIPVEQLRQAARSERPVTLVEGRGASRRVFFGTSVRVGGRIRGSLGFAGSRELDARFAATDKDLIALMAQWLATELERQERPASAETPAPAPTRAPRRAPARSGVDLNATLRRSEAKLRRHLGADATLDLELDPALPAARLGRVSPPALVESLVAGASRLAPAGRVRIRTAALAPGPGTGGEESAGDVTLAVEVDGAGDIDDAALAQLFDTRADAEAWARALPLAQLERLLRHGGGDLSVSLEPPHRAVLTAFAPAAAPRAARKTEAPAAAPAQPSR